MLGKYLENLKTKKPVIHCITNYVTVNDVANAVLAAGASPIMSDHPAEAADVSGLADGLVINIGTLNDPKFEAMIIAGKTAKAQGKPVVLDPVGAGASKHRTGAALEIISAVKPDIIRANISEIKTLALGHARSRGVDADFDEIKEQSSIEDTAKLALSFSKLTGSVVIISGSTDTAAFGDEAYAMYNGDPMMRTITGSGCMLSAICAAFAAANTDDRAMAAIAAVSLMGICAENAAAGLKSGEGNASFRNHLIDAIYNMSPEELDSRAEYRKVK